MTAGDLRAALEAAGIPIGPYDLLIAAQALRNRATLVTANISEFARVRGLVFIIVGMDPLRLLHLSQKLRSRLKR